MEHYHISVKGGGKCIDIYLDREDGKVTIADTLDPSNRIAISGEDWDILVDRIVAGKIGKVSR